MQYIIRLGEERAVLLTEVGIGQANPVNTRTIRTLCLLHDKIIQGDGADGLVCVPGYLGDFLIALVLSAEAIGIAIQVEP